MLIKKYWKSIIWAIIVIILSSLSGDKVNRMPLINIPHSDKIVHFGLYFVFVSVMIFESNMNTFKSGLKTNTIIYSFFIGVLLGVLMEILQRYLFTERSAEFFDFIANTLGSAAGSGFVYILYLRYKRR